MTGVLIEQIPGMKKALLIITIVLCLSTSGCQLRKTFNSLLGRNKTPAPQNEEQIDPGEPEDKITLEAAEKSEEKTADEEKAAEAVLEVNPLRNPASREELFYIGLGGPKIIPEDFMLGPLQDRYPKYSDEGEIYQSIYLFIEGLKTGDLYFDSVHPGRRDQLRRLLSYPMEQEYFPVSFRLGEIEYPEIDSAFMDIILFGRVGRSKGEIYVAKEEKLWYITDIHVDFSLLLAEDKQEDEQFDPSAFNYRLLD
jgi:hypothetical protein